MLIANPRASRTAYPNALRRVMNIASADESGAWLAHWPLVGHARTPLRALPNLAARLGVASVSVKDESCRSPLGSFKALGAPIALVRLVKRLRRTQALDPQGLVTGRYAAELADLTVISATDGNHGRALAAAARAIGCGCVIVLHANVDAERERAISAYGARIVRIAGNYDESVVCAAQLAQANGWYVVSDTSYDGYEAIPRDVMQGYGVIAAEAAAQAAEDDGRPFTHVFLQGGVGGLAAAVCAHFWEQLGERRPRFIVVEPDKAACLYESARAGKPVAVHGDLDTVMAGLACGEVSLLAWEVLHPGAQAFLTVDDEAALETVRLLASGKYGDAPIVAGESAVAGLTGCLAALADPAVRDALGLDAGSRVLVFGSEGATDPELYQRIVGKSAAEVEAEAVA